MPTSSREKASVIVAVIACIGAVTSASYTYLNGSRGLDIELVKIGIGILSVNPKEAQTVGARQWAVEIIEKYSNHEFSKEAKHDLLNSRLNVRNEVENAEPEYVTLRGFLFPDGSEKADPELVIYIRELFAPRNIAIGPILVGAQFASLREKISACIVARNSGKPCPAGSLSQFLSDNP